MKNKKWIIAIILTVVVLGALGVIRNQIKKNSENTAKHVLDVGFLPVTCHLTCPVTDFATSRNPDYRFLSQRFTDFPTMAEAFKAGRLKAAFFIAPMAMKLREQGVKAKIVYLGHRDGSTVMVKKDSAIHNLRDLEGKKFGIPSRYSNQYLVIRKLMKDQGVQPEKIQFVEVPPPEMPAALANKGIDAYFVGEPHAAKSEVNGVGRVLYHAKDIWPKFISCVLIVSEELIESNPDIVKELVAGIAESGEWAETHREKAAAVAAPYYRQDEKLLKYVLTTPGDRVSYRMLTPEDQDIKVIHDMAVEAGLLAEPIDLSQLVDRSFIPKEIKSKEL
ncbi:ABC transporter substrate-binding protein [Bdellovibrio bacteriovorus]|uniref:ABC transporter substrate-binding protein n=1 Tax=Bdellovibrio TaxID=958 RepID=UPI0035A98761